MSILENYDSSALLFNTNFLESASKDGMMGYRGELVLIEGEVADAKGHHKPPVEVMRGAALLGTDKLKLAVGAIDHLASVETLFDKYQEDFGDDIKMVLFVVDIKSAFQTSLNGTEMTLIPLVQGVPWNEMLDELALEKSDFKGQSPADKIVTLYDELLDYKPKYPTISFPEALNETTDTVREGWGAV